MGWSTNYNMNAIKMELSKTKALEWNFIAMKQIEMQT